MRKKDLQNAKESKKDEFYTQLVDIELELKNYKDFFKVNDTYVKVNKVKD